MFVRECFSHVWLFVTPWTSVCSPSGSSGHGFLQARILEGVAAPFSRDLPDLGIEPMSLHVSCTGRRLLYHWRPLGCPYTEIGLQNETLMLLSVDSTLASSRTLNSKGWIGQSCCPVVRTPCCHCRGRGSILGHGTENLQALQPGQKKKGYRS